MYECLINEAGEKTDCPVCTLEKEQEEKHIQAEKKRVQNILDRVDGLPKRYREAGFLNYEKTEKSEKAFRTALAFAHNPCDHWLLMLGANGVGKTHLVHGVLKVTGGIYRDFDDISVDLQDAQAGFDGGMNKVLNKYSYAPMLVIDEVDKVKKTEGRIGWLNIILRRRYNEMLPVILCGNIDVNSLCKHIDLNGGEAMKDRIREVGIVVHCNWESYRPKKRAEWEQIAG